MLLRVKKDMQLLLAIGILFALDFWLYRTVPAIKFCFHIIQLAIREISFYIMLHRRGILCFTYRGPLQGSSHICMYNKLAILDD